MISATSGIFCTKNIRFTSGISTVSGLSGNIPEGATAWYDFSNPNPNKAILNQVNFVEKLSTASYVNGKNTTQLDGSIINWPQNEAALVLNSGVLIEGEATNKISQSRDLSTMILSDVTLSDTGDVSPDPTGSTNWQRVTATTTTFPALIKFTSNVGVPTNYALTVYARRGSNPYACMSQYNIGGWAIYNLDTGLVHLTGGTGFVAAWMEPIDAANGIYKCFLKGIDDTGGFARQAVLCQTDGTSPTTGEVGGYVDYWQFQRVLATNPSSDIFTGTGEGTRDADDSQIDMTGVSVTSKIGFDNLTLQTDIVDQVLWESGTASLFWDGANMVAQVGAVQSTIAATPTSISSAHWEYNGANVIVYVDDITGTGAASIAPVFNATANIGSDEAVANHAQGLYQNHIVIEADAPESFQAFYPFLSDFEDKVSGTLTASFDNAPTFGGGGINTVANTNITVPTAGWDTTGDFRFGYINIGKTVADVIGQVLLQTGNMGITTGIGITFAEIGASISSLAVDSNTIVGECFLKYVGGMLSIVIDGVESTPVASVAPTIGAFAQVGANISNLNPAPGTYGGLLFEVL